MEKRNWRIVIGILGLLLISLAACRESTPEVTVSEEKEQTDTTTNDTDFTVVDEEGNTDIDTEALDEELPQETSNDALSAIEIEGLLFMREEEKLARDVYLTLGEMWNMNIFQNISRSEQTHTDAIKVLLDQFGLEDPMSTDEVGVFENEDLQTLYDELVELGSQSLGDALRVGAAIEEIDILDLEEYIGQTDNVDIQIVYENLTKGSRNHLRSFVSVLEKQTGETYEPQYLTQEVFKDIIDSPMERGGDHENGNGHGNGGNGNREGHGDGDH